MLLIIILFVLTRRGILAHQFEESTINYTQMNGTANNNGSLVKENTNTLLN
jgi:hypothetical protein